VYEIDLALVQSHLISLLIDSQVDDSPEKNLWTGVSTEDAELAKN